MNRYNTLRVINPKLAKEFTHLENFCKYDEHSDITEGIALKEIRTARVFCFMNYDFWRGRGNYSECQKSDCKHYCFVSPDQRSLADFVGFK